MSENYSIALLEWYVGVVFSVVAVGDYLLGDTYHPMLRPVYIVLLFNYMTLLAIRGADDEFRFPVFVFMIAINIGYVVWKSGLYILLTLGSGRDVAGAGYFGGWVLETITMAIIYGSIIAIVVFYKFAHPIAVLIKAIGWFAFLSVVIAFDSLGFWQMTLSAWLFLGILFLAKAAAIFHNWPRVEKIVRILHTWDFFVVMIVLLIVSAFTQVVL